jgi:hypothetical protein
MLVALRYGTVQNVSHEYENFLSQPKLYIIAVLRIRDPMPFWPLDPDPGSGMGLFRNPDLGFQNPDTYFLELCDKFLDKKFYNSLKTGPNFFSSAFQK